ncbi:hypothetical protein AX17_004753 [Amanita inopinata Kibby_2008]|nr:hypothetical protein AX17_004753 [Amanita inopinata Kibby_2008]
MPGSQPDLGTLSGDEDVAVLDGGNVPDTSNIHVQDDGNWDYRDGAVNGGGDGDVNVDQGDEPPDDTQMAIDHENDSGDDSNEEFDFDTTHITQSSCPRIEIVSNMVRCIRDARLEDDLDEGALRRLRNPPSSLSAIDSTTRLSIDMFLAQSDASKDLYARNRRALAHHVPSVSIHSYHIVKKTIMELTGVEEVQTDMCINSCLAYVGPFAEYNECPKCKEPRYEHAVESSSKKRLPRQRFCTIPLGPQIQAMWRSPEGSDRMRYGAHSIQEVIAEFQVNDRNSARMKMYTTGKTTWMQFSEATSVKTTFCACFPSTALNCIATLNSKLQAFLCLAARRSEGLGWSPSAIYRVPAVLDVWDSRHAWPSYHKWISWARRQPWMSPVLRGSRKTKEGEFEVLPSRAQTRQLRRERLLSSRH